MLRGSPSSFRLAITICSVWWTGGLTEQLQEELELLTQGRTTVKP